MESDFNLSENDKRSLIQRSASYPNITIEKAVEYVSQLKKSFPISSFTRQDIAVVLKRSSINRETAASVQYGLLEKTMGEGYKLSTKAKVILNPVSEEERLQNLKDCFYTPKLYVELIDKFKGHELPPLNQFIAILSRFYNITENAAPQAADIFIQNALYTDLLNENKILLADNQQDILPTESDTVHNYNTDKQSQDNNLNNTNMQPDINRQQNTLLLEEISGSVSIKIRLSEKKFAQLIYPESINEKDIQILFKQIEALALTL